MVPGVVHRSEAEANEDGQNPIPIQSIPET